MKTERIDQLLKMAGEVDEIEAEAEGGSPVFVFPAGARRERGGRSGWLVASAAAACLGVAAFGGWELWHEVSGARRSIAVLGQDEGAGVRSDLARGEKKNGRTEVVSAPVSVPRIVDLAPLVEAGRSSPQGVAVAPQVMPARANDEPRQCGVVMVIVHDLRGMSRCVQVRQEDWKGRCAADLNSWEVEAARRGVAQGCPATPARQVLVLALTGPAEALPSTQRRAEEVAQCILGLPRQCDADGACYQSAATTCLPPDVEFKVETVAQQ